MRSLLNVFTTWQPEQSKPPPTPKRQVPRLLCISEWKAHTAPIAASALVDSDALEQPLLLTVGHDRMVRVRVRTLWPLVPCCLHTALTHTHTHTHLHMLTHFRTHMHTHMLARCSYGDWWAIFWERC